MYIKETPWEERNLGVHGIEFYFEENDSADALGQNVLKNREFNYQVVHLPVGKMDILNRLVENGFAFSETKFEISANLKQLTLPRMFARYERGLSFREANDADMERVYSAIGEGVFDTDKISLDPHFGIKAAGRRYCLWLRDALRSGNSFPNVVSFMDRDIGFFVLNQNSAEIGDSFLAGLFDRKADGGLGFSVLYFPMKLAQSRGMRRIVSGVSSNNPASLRMHLRLGYEIDAMKYILVKHI